MTLFDPPLPGEPLHPTKTVAADTGRTDEAVRCAIKDGRIEGVRIAGRWFVPDAERQRLLRDGWPSRNPASTRFWEDWRAYRRERAAELGAA